MILKNLDLPWVHNDGPTDALSKWEPSHQSIHVTHFLQIFEIHGIDAAVINGTQSVEECDQTVVTFQNDKKSCVLLLSNIGIVGLNLTAATVVILFVSEFHCNRTHIHLHAGSMLVAYASKSNYWVCLAPWPDWGSHCLQFGLWPDSRLFNDRLHTVLEQFLATQHGRGRCNKTLQVMQSLDMFMYRHEKAAWIW